MATIKMSYIFIEKEKHKSQSIKKILLDIIDSVVQIRKEDTLQINDIEIKYRIIQKRNSERCFLEMISKERVNKSVPALQIIDDALLKSSQQRYYCSIRDYDGISESFCKRLYPKYAEFERKLRSFVLFILTKAYGSNWRTETISEELLAVIKENAHGNVSLNETLEHMDLATLESYLFEKRHINYPNVICEKLSTESMENLKKEEICAIIEGMRPTSLWERHFEKFGSQEIWAGKISEIHNMRNKVAHQKTISISEFTTTNKKINEINRDLSNVIEEIREDNFTDYSVVDILGSFAMLTENMMKDIIPPRAFIDVVAGFNARIQEILKPISTAYSNDMLKAFSNIGKIYEGFNWKTASTGIGKSAIALTESLIPSQNFANSFVSAKALSQNFAIPQMFSSKINTGGIMQSAFEIPQVKGFDANRTFQDILGHNEEEQDIEENN